MSRDRYSSDPEAYDAFMAGLRESASDQHEMLQSAAAHLSVADYLGDVPWNVYSLAAIAVIAGLTHVPHVYLYSSAALKSLAPSSSSIPKMA